MVDATPEGVVLGLHVLAGFGALFAGAGALATEKGGRRHRLAGRAFVYAMAVVSATSLALYALDPGATRLFLAMVAVFSYYFVFSGYRVLSRKRPDDGPTAVDWAGVGLLGIASVGLLGMGTALALGGTGFAVVLLVFGGIGTAFAARDAREFRREPGRPGEWLTGHLARMIGGYVAAVTAFSTVNFTFLPTVLRWLWPTLLGVPAIVVLVRRYGADGGSSAAA